jgi:hypothetical protein
LIFATGEKFDITHESVSIGTLPSELEKRLSPLATGDTQIDYIDNLLR